MPQRRRQMVRLMQGYLQGAQTNRVQALVVPNAKVVKMINLRLRVQLLCGKNCKLQLSKTHRYFMYVRYDYLTFGVHAVRWKVSPRVRQGLFRVYLQPRQEPCP